jgi:hypothetical protein
MVHCTQTQVANPAVRGIFRLRTGEMLQCNLFRSAGRQMPGVISICDMITVAAWSG